MALLCETLYPPVVNALRSLPKCFTILTTEDTEFHRGTAHRGKIGFNPLCRYERVNLPFTIRIIPSGFDVCNSAGSVASGKS